MHLGANQVSGETQSAQREHRYFRRFQEHGFFGVGTFFPILTLNHCRCWLCALCDLCGEGSGLNGAGSFGSESGVARLHLSWQQNGDGLDLGLAANRLLLSGRAVWWCQESRRTVEAGDYIVEGEANLAERLATLGIAASLWRGPVPRSATPLAAPRVSLLAGSSSAYPYFAYYALCLIRLGVGYQPVDGRAIAAGALDGSNLFVLPGGFAIWGLDAAERSPGADAAVRAFLRRGGACLGSCGGAYYLSAGRPGWTGTAWVRPRYTHEYLQSGAGVVAVSLRPTPIAFGLPGSVEIPYYHGPIYDEPGGTVQVLGRFSDLCLPGRLGIDNPLGERQFAREMAGRPAILSAAGRRGRAILFSPHPEMGDLLRKYIALDGYIRKYLPRRGRRTMEETLAAYRTLDAPAFRLVLNAVHCLAAQGSGAALRVGEGGPGAGTEPTRALASLRRLRQAAANRLAAVPVGKRGEYARVVRHVAEALGGRIGPAAAALRAEFVRVRGALPPLAKGVCEAWSPLAAQGAASLERPSGPTRPAAENLLQVELAISLMDAVRRCLEVDRVLGLGERTR